MSSGLRDAPGVGSPDAPIEIRRLGLEDLVAVEGIERRSYQTPWSRSMFAGELAKATGLCLGAFAGDGGKLHLAALFRKKILHFGTCRLILCVGGQMLGVPPLGQNRFLTTKSDFL